MKRITVLLSVTLLALAMIVTATTTAAAAPAARQTGGPAVYVGEVTAAQLSTVLAGGVDRQEVVTTPGGAAGSVRVEIILGERLATSLIAQGIPLARKQVAQRRAAVGAPVFRKYSGPGGLRAELVDIAKKNPRLVKLVVIGKSVNGQDIVALKVTKDATTVADGTRPAVLYSSAQHAREWITPEMTRRLLHHYVDDYGRDPAIRKIVDSTELWFIPVANPDGYDYTFTDNRLWRKNLRDNDGDGQITGNDGVDPNRNFPTKWGYDNEGSSPSPDSETYRGPSAASEPETRALDSLLRKVRFTFQVNYHSAAELLLYGVGWQVATPTPDDLVYQAMTGDDAHPAVPGYDPDISAELYTTNGETTEHAQNTYRTLAFTPEMATCETASAVDPTDAFNPADCGSVFEFPDSEALIQAEYVKNIPFALAVARSAQDPSHPVSVVGRSTPDFAVDTFSVSYGDPQTVAVTARRDLGDLRVHYRIAGGREQVAAVQEWSGGERYGNSNETYYAEFRGIVRGAKPGNKVEVWFTGTNQASRGAVASEHFTYTLQRTGGSVLVLANEDYEGFDRGVPDPATKPRYLQQYVDALTAAGISSAVWDVSKQGVPHDLGVLGHFSAVVWYLGNNRLTQDRADVITDTPFGPLEDASVAERQQYLTLAVRDYLNGGGKLALTGETAAYYGVLGTALGGIYYGLDGAPNQDCVVTADFFSDCLLLADDFSQYYLGAFSRAPRRAPTSAAGTGPLAGRSVALAGTPSNPIDEAGTFLPTSSVLPVAQFPQFGGVVSSTYVGGPPGNLETFEGSWFAAASHADNSYMRLARTVDLTAVAASAVPTLNFALSYDTEPGYDNVIVEAHTVGAEDWTTLPELGGLTDTDPPAECEVGFLLEEHPFLGHYLTLGTPCGTTGTSGRWNRITGTSDGWQQVGFDLSAYAGKKVEVSVSYVTDAFTGGAGVFVDQTRLTIGGAQVQPEGFETGLGPWAAPGAPAGSPANAGDFVRAQSKVGSSITTADTVLLGFGLEQIARPADRSAVLGQIINQLVRGRR